MAFRRQPPCERVGDDSFVVRLSADERQVLLRMFADLDQMIAGSEDPSAPTFPTMSRLFPPAFTDHDGDDADHDEEYQRLMRTELVASKRAGLSIVREAIEGASKDRLSFDTAGLTAFMQSLNSLRLVLGSLLGISDDDQAALADQRMEESPEYALFAWSGWMIEWTVTALSP